jgi:Protein of unknown function (DUF4239)
MNLNNLYFDRYVMIILFLKLLTFVAVFVIGFLVSRKYVDHFKFRMHNDVAGAIYGVIGSVYAVLLAFIVIIVWEQFTDAEKCVNTEVSHLTILYRYADAFPDSTKDKIHKTIICYMNDVIHDEWKCMDQLTYSPKARHSCFEICKIFMDMNPQNESQTLWKQESMAEIREVFLARRMRLNSMLYDIHPLIWLTLIIGAIIVIGFGYFFDTKSRRAHLLLIIGLSTFIGMTLLLIDTIVHPFCGLISVSPQSFVFGLDYLLRPI